MKKLLVLPLIIFLFNCESHIKNSDKKVVVEEGTQVEEIPNQDVKETTVTEIHYSTDSLIGFWVGYFLKDDDFDRSVRMGEYDSWNKENKINISIDKIDGDKVVGHSVVAGNDRPFKGTMKKESNGVYAFDVKEPGDHKYDGAFQFKIHLENNQMIGKWRGYKEINIRKRKYNLDKKVFKYNPNHQLNWMTYKDWNKTKNVEKSAEYEDGIVETWMEEAMVQSTHASHEINASTTLLKKEDVENLSKTDLMIIRNTIYARHGYSYKNQPLRVFFDRQPWYIPVHTDIRANLTDIEKQNIKLLLKYEKNASEYYDTFGRG
ncbi:YARHG domain-containing protein [Flammeovirga sp. MY04]|uniref:YARHG domain-containing protein n=1 Tax=Flammeovirga sp. MY04 TaxID=1191459 RepID=UPI0008258A8F|nr:YARHG domain-containing protein [Flammeovirga sp. MY04]ANQ51888.2 YARHG domain-containing protein [Flammeovirga sp. MY04]